MNMSVSSNDQDNSEKTKCFWKIMLGGATSLGKDNTEYSDLRLFEDEIMLWIDPFLPWIHNHTPDLDFALSRSLLIFVDGRCYLKTENGYQGLCYPTARPTDEMWGMDGSNLPFVLRLVKLSKELID